MIDALALLATLALGLYAGGMLTEAMILVPYWRRMPASDFFSLHGTLGPSLLRFYGPLTALAFILSAASAAASPHILSWKTLAALLCTAAVLTFFLYFKRANASFADHSLEDSALSKELAKWSVWHFARTIFVMGAFAAASLANTH